MREIKFRAWDKEEKTMIENIDIAMMKDWSCYSINKALNCWKSEIIVMQYTGLKDRNKKKIYEGDILNGVNLVELYIVEDMCEFYYEDREMIITGEDCEVIGNIYENKELIK